MNRLADQTSPYLRQHADNPVDWFPWGEEAFARARAEDRPILLSVGYSACHWCHVMAHESFEDDDVAAVMNRLFVNVKVDREERPDVDAIYMQAVQAMTGHGGWPMTVFLTPQGEPFYGGTYYPKDDRSGLPGFVRVLEAIDDAWNTRRGELEESATQLQEAIERTTQITGDTHDLSVELLARARAGAAGQFDARYGGFGGAPKFPQAMTLDFVIGAHVREPSPETLDIVTVSLDAMAAGGMYDQVGGGFHRYSVDAFWLVPHFEKMLYDQALLVRAYTGGFLVTGEPRYQRVVEETIGYVLRDLHHEAGGFFCAEDADSEGVEGKFYVWALDELEAVCGDDAAEVVRYFGVTSSGNFVDPHTDFGGNILHVVDPTEARPAAVERALPKLFAHREERVRPGLDDKVLLAWNALFVRSLAEAASVFERTDWMDAARANARFLLTSMRREDRRLLRSWQNGRAAILAYAEDYAALLEALLTLTEVDDVTWLRDARTVADDLLRLFADSERGGVFTTGTDAEQLIVRPKDIQDNATPCENSLAANGLLRLAALTGAREYEDAALGWVQTTGAIAAEHPTGFAYLLGAVDRAVRPPLEVAVIGAPDDPETEALWRVATRRVLPGAVKLRAAPGEGANLSPLLVDRPLVGGRATAYVCERYACRQPVTDPKTLAAQLDDAIRDR